MAAPRKIDYSRLEAGWRAGIMSPQELAEEYERLTGIPVTRRAIIKHFEGLKVPRDLSKKIQARANELVAKHTVTALVPATQLPARIPENAIVEANANAQASIVIRQKAEIGRYQTICDNLLAELETQAMSREDLIALAELKALVENQQEPDDAAVDRQLRAFAKLLKLGDRAETFKKLVEAKTRLVAMERQAFGIKDDDDGKPKSPVNFYLNMGGGTAQIAIIQKPEEKS